MRKAQVLVSALLLVLLLVACAPKVAPAPAVPAKATWQTEWDKTLAVAKQEGTVVVWCNSGQWRQPLTEALMKAYGLKLEYVVVARGAEAATKLLAERRAGLYTSDFLITGIPIPLFTMKPAGAIDSLDPFLVLPEVVDPKLWYGGQLPFADKEHTVFAALNYALAMVAVNTDLVKPGEITSYNDLLNPKWKGKIILNNPTIPGAGMYITLMGDPLTGKGRWEFLQQLAKNDPIVLRDQRMMIDWLAHGKAAIVAAPPTDPLTEFMRLGAPIRVDTPKEGGVMSSGWGNLSVINKAPHPNAAKVFINWFLGKEGMTVASKSVGYSTARLDVPTNFIDPVFVLDPKVKYFNANTEEYNLRLMEDPTKMKEIFGPMLR